MKYTVFFLLMLSLSGFAQVEMHPGNEGILFTENGRQVMYYQITPKSLNGTYARSNYFHPVWGPGGQVITEDFPEDHLHHRGIFWAWHQVVVDGQNAGDLWELKGISQEVSEVEFIALPGGSGLFKSEIFWSSESGVSLGIPGAFLKENIAVTIHPRKRDFRRIDFEISLTALRYAVRLGGSEDEKGYSGFSVRLKLADEVEFSGPGGTVEPRVTQVESPGWVNINCMPGSGNQPYGLVILDHRSNPGYPQPWILRRQKSMQNAAFPGRELTEIPQDKPLVLKYSLLVHDGKLRDRAIRREAAK
jgi:hypothetical protein